MMGGGQTDHVVVVITGRFYDPDWAGRKIWREEEMMDMDNVTIRVTS
jgi:hypothetical protein